MDQVDHNKNQVALDVHHSVLHSQAQVLCEAEMHHEVHRTLKEEAAEAKVHTLKSFVIRDEPIVSVKLKLGH